MIQLSAVICRELSRIRYRHNRHTRMNGLLAESTDFPLPRGDQFTEHADLNTGHGFETGVVIADSNGCIPLYNNATVCFDPGNASVAASDDADLGGVLSLNHWAVVLLVFPFFTVFGNVLVVLSVYREKSLQSVTNYFIVSLAIADIMVAILVMPLAVYVEVKGSDSPVCNIWMTPDVWTNSLLVNCFQILKF